MSNCADDVLELLSKMRSSKNISETKEIVDMVCGTKEEISKEE